MARYNYNPVPRSGSFTPEYGGVPGALEAPDPFADLEALYPNLSGTNAQAARNVAAQLRGELSPETRAALQDDAARFGITSGMPGADLAFRRGIVRQAGAREAQQQRGQENFLNLQTGINRNQILPPELRADIADRNAVYGAAPDPAANAMQIQRTFDANRGGFGGGGSVTGGGRSGGMPSVGRAPAGPSDFWAGPTRGTGFQSPVYGGDYIPPLPGGFSPGPQGRDLWSPFAAQEFDPFAPFGPSNQYDPFGNYGGYEGPIDYGVTEGNAGAQFDPNWDDYGSFDPNWDY